MIYTYEIIRVDEAARAMEVVYTHEVHGSIHVGARLPFEGEPLESVIRQFAPIGHWRDFETPVSIPQTGASGAIEEATSSEPFASNEVQL